MPYERAGQDSESEFSDTEHIATPKQLAERKRQLSTGEMIRSLEHKRMRIEGGSSQGDVSADFSVGSTP